MPAASLYWKQVFSAVEPGAIAAPRRASKAGLRDTAAEPDDIARRTVLALSPKVWSDIKAVNEAVNSAALPISDQNHYGRSDHWSLPLRSGKRLLGDCEDFVLEKKRQLTLRGYPASALSIALVRTSWGENHAVLIVGGDRGEFVLDSLTGEISPWSQARYTLLLRQSPFSDDVWVLPGSSPEGGSRSPALAVD